MPRSGDELRGGPSGVRKAPANWAAPGRRVPTAGWDGARAMPPLLTTDGLLVDDPACQSKGPASHLAGMSKALIGTPPETRSWSRHSAASGWATVTYTLGRS
jgi:hypothetical protein